MKILYFLYILFFFSINSFPQKGWVNQTSGTNVVLNSVYFQDQYNGWAVGQSGALLQTTDAGEHWIARQSGTTASLKSVFFFNKKFGWIVGSEFNIPTVSKSAILRTTDGGTNWNLDLMMWLPNKIFFINQDTGWAICSIPQIYPDYYGVIIKTTDSGITWFHQFDGAKTSWYDGINFINENEGWVVGHTDANPILLKTTNGGNDWISQPISTNVSAIWFVDSSVGYLAGEGCLILKTTNNGSFWSEQSSGMDQNLHDLFFKNKLTGWAVGSNGIILGSTDAGNTWSRQSEGKASYLTSVYFADVNNGWAVGSYGAILHTSNGGIPSRFSYFPLAPGNKWFFSNGLDQVIHIEIVVEKDTLLADEHEYAKLNVYFPNSGTYSPINGWAYLRVDSNKLIQYPDKIFLDYNMQIGDTVLAYLNPAGTDTSTNTYNDLYKASLNNIEQISVFNRYLNTYYFNSTPYDYYSFIDSIGFNTLHETSFQNLFPEYLLGCVIDGKIYGDVTSIKEQNEVVTEYKLFQNYPNPFNPTTKIEYSIPKSSFVTLKVYDILGREVATLVKEEKPAGEYKVTFNGSNLSSGVYFYQLKLGSFIESRKFVLMR